MRERADRRGSRPDRETPILFNAGFALLAQRFDYPDILRRPTHEVLERFRAGGTGLLLIWWAFALSAVLFAALAVLLAIAVDDADPTVVILGLVFGVLASVVQFLGLIRWPFLVPYLARSRARLAAWRGGRRRLQALHRYLGVAVGEPPRLCVHGNLVDPRRRCDGRLRDPA